MNRNNNRGGEEEQEPEGDGAMLFTGGAYQDQGTGEGVLLNPAFFPNHQQLQLQSNGFANFGLDMNTVPNLVGGGWTLEQFMAQGGFTFNPYLQMPNPFESMYQLPIFPPHTTLEPRQIAIPKEKTVAEKEADEFLDRLLVERLNADDNTSSIVSNPVKKSRALSPLPSSTPKGPKVMAACASKKLGPKEPVCYNCGSDKHGFQDCTRQCPHCNRNGHLPYNCDYRTLSDGTTSKGGDEDTDGDMEMKEIEIVSKDLTHRTVYSKTRTRPRERQVKGPNKPINLSSANSGIIGKRQEEKNPELGDKGSTGRSLSRRRIRQHDIYTPAPRKFQGDMHTMISEKEQRAEWRRQRNRELRIRRRSGSPQRVNGHRGDSNPRNRGI